MNDGKGTAILSYEGIQYQYMAPSVFETSQYTYMQEHLRILSGFYGVLKPMDGVTPYRLEMKQFNRLGYCYWEELSTEKEYVFIREFENMKKIWLALFHLEKMK